MVAQTARPRRVNPEPGGGERKKEASQKRLENAWFWGSSEASGAITPKSASLDIISITKSSGDYLDSLSRRTAGSGRGQERGTKQMQEKRSGAHSASQVCPSSQGKVRSGEICASQNICVLRESFYSSVLICYLLFAP